MHLLLNKYLCADLWMSGVGIRQVLRRTFVQITQTAPLKGIAHEIGPILQRAGYCRRLERAYIYAFLFTEFPVSGALINFVRPGDLEEIERFSASLTGEEYTRRLALSGRTLNFTIGLEGEKVTFRFNFHFDLDDLIAFKAKISETSILELKQESAKFIAEIYNLELEGETE